MKFINYTALRLNLKHWLNLVIDDVEEVIIIRKDQKDIVLISLEEYNSLIQTNYLLSARNRDILLGSVAEVKGAQKDIHVLWH